MTIYEKDGTYKVRFEEGLDGNVVGRIDGDGTPVFVHRDSYFRASPGET